jgi:hypothetical protein
MFDLKNVKLYVNVIVSETDGMRKNWNMMAAGKIKGIGVGGT